MRREDRIKQLMAFLEKEPESSFLKYALAMEFGNAEEFQKAIEILQEIRNNDREYTATYYHLAAFLLETGQREEAERVYEEGITICKTVGQQHHLSELQSAYTNLLYDD